MLEELDRPKKTKIIRKITHQRLKNIGLYYLKRFESSVANLRIVLRRRVDSYVYQDKDFDKNLAYGWIEEIIEDFMRYDYINDARYAEIKIKSYINAGKSPRYILGKLREKGIDEKIANNLLDLEEYDPYEMAMKLAKKKKIGMFSTNEELRKERRNKDLAVLVRAGFDYDVAIKVLETDCC